MDGLGLNFDYETFDYVMTEDIVARLRDRAVEAAIEADGKRMQWAKAVTLLAKKEMVAQWGLHPTRLVGTLQTKSKAHAIAVEDLHEPSSYYASVPYITYSLRLKSGKLSKQIYYCDFPVFMKCFQPDATAKST